jgi:hypothetical protein
MMLYLLFTMGVISGYFIACLMFISRDSDQDE